MKTLKGTYLTRKEILSIWNYGSELCLIIKLRIAMQDSTDTELIKKKAMTSRKLS